MDLQRLVCNDVTGKSEIDFIVGRIPGLQSLKVRELICAPLEAHTSNTLERRGRNQMLNFQGVESQSAVIMLGKIFREEARRRAEAFCFQERWSMGVGCAYRIV